MTNSIPVVPLLLGQDANATLSNCELSHTIAENIISTTGGSISIFNSSFTHNSARSLIHIEASSDVIISNSLFAYNFVLQAVLDLDNSQTLLKQLEIHNNIVKAEGKSVVSISGNEENIVQAINGRNNTGQLGGVFSCTDGPYLSISNSTFQ